MKPIVVVALLLLSAGCAQTVELVREGDYMTFEHAFTTRGAEETRQRAEKVCTERKQVALQTARACSLERCTTHYLCVDRDGLAR